MPANEIIAVKAAEGAKLIGVSKSTLYEIMKREDCDFAFKLNGTLLISVEKLKAWVNRQTEKGKTA